MSKAMNIAKKYAKVLLHRLQKLRLIYLQSYSSDI